MTALALSISLVLLMAFTGTQELGAQSAPLKYPVTRIDAQTDNYHGTQVADPYRWLENDTAKETSDWVVAQNKVTFDYLNTIPHRVGLRKRLKALFSYPRFSAPFKEGGKYFFLKNNGLQNQAVMYVQSTLQGKPDVLLDPNKLSVDGTVAVNSFAVSHDGNYLAYGLSESGSDWQRVLVRDVATKKDLADELKWVKFSYMSWTHDNLGFFYSRYPEPASTASAFKQSNIDQRLYYHKLGTAQSEDILIYTPADPSWFVDATVADDGRYVTIFSAPPGVQNLIHYIDLGDAKEPNVKAPIKPLIDSLEAQYYPVGNDGTVFYLHTDHGAPKGKVISIDAANLGAQQSHVIIPQSADVIEGVALMGNQFIVSYLNDAHSVVKFYELNGKFTKELPVPSVGSVQGVGGNRFDTEFFYAFSSYLYPRTIMRYDMQSGSSSVFHGPQFVFDPTLYQTKQLWFASKDGTRVPMYVICKKTIVLDGSNPTLVYGYGGFSQSLTPDYNPSILPWIENGGVYVVVNLRGGGEFGEAWHLAGTKEKKQHVFDDFIAAAENLIQLKYTSSEKLVMQGGSNGGLLVGAVMCQRPDLFAVALPSVGVMDMLRYQYFTVGSAWSSDYGLSSDPQEFKYLYAYSPLHNLKRGVKYPATLVTTADHDDRVFPAHSYKFAAQLQTVQSEGAPALIRIETKAGHGAGKPTAKYIEQATDELGFAMFNLGMPVPK